MFTIKDVILIIIFEKCKANLNIVFFVVAIFIAVLLITFFMNENVRKTGVNLVAFILKITCRFKFICIRNCIISIFVVLNIAY